VSRIADDLGAERNRLTNRMREQLWRYFPAMLDLESDLGAEWLLDLWEIAPTPHKAIRVREATVAKVLKRNRIRRFDAAHVLDVLRKPPVQVAAGTTEAQPRISRRSRAHPARQSPTREAHRQLDALTARLIPSEENGPGQRKQHDVEILASLREWEGSSSPRCSQKPSMLCSDEITPPAQFDRGRACHQESGKSCIVVRRQACHDRLANAMYHWRASQFSATPEAARNMPPSEAEVIAMAEPAIDRRPPSQCRLRHVKNRDHFQPLPRGRKNPLINGGESPPPAPALRLSPANGN